MRRGSYFALQLCGICIAVRVFLSVGSVRTQGVGLVFAGVPPVSAFYFGFHARGELTICDVNSGHYSGCSCSRPWAVPAVGKWIWTT